MKFKYFHISLIFGWLVTSPLAFSAGLLPISSANTTDKQALEVPKNLVEDQVGDFVAPLDERQVRDLLINNLKINANINQAANQQQPVSIIKLLKGINNPYTPLGGGVASIFAATGTYLNEVSEVMDTITDGQGIQGFIKLLGMLVIVIVCAWLVEFLCLYRWRRKELPEIEPDDSEVWRIKFSQPFFRFLVSFIGLVIFSIAGYILANFFISDESNFFTVMMRLFDSVVVYRFFILLGRLFMNSPPLGLDLVDDTINKSALLKCIAVFLFLYLIVFDGFVNTFYEYGLPDAHYVLSAAVIFGLIINPIIIGFVWTQRYDIDRILFGEVGNQWLECGSYAHAARAAIWPSVVTFLLLFVFLMWQILVITGNTKGQGATEQAWWLTILFPLIDLMVSSLLNKLTSLEIFQHKRFQARKQRFIFIIRNVVRFVLIVVLLLDLLEAWGFKLLDQFKSVGGDDIIGAMIDIGVAILLGFIIWEAIQLWMEHKLPDEPEEGMLEIEGEGGGAAATRTETLLPLLKTTLVIVLFVIVVMSILYSLGVQIAPLLAGAGVIGIAVGFGSQKLVQDIISGVFFLIDDAFRKGEYVELAGLRGTVEKLSVRSMRLRHHLGAVQTIPYGEIATVKNLSRDWVIMKLELRLPYDVDIEKVRKIIKKVGQEMLEDEEIGPNMLQPLKSQGVMRVEESALIIRMKFTAKPGEQWIVRRVAYTKVRDALAAAGIEFAHREVKVRLPQELENLQKMDYQRKLHIEGENADVAVDEINAKSAVIAAAAMSAVVAQELAAQDKIDDDNGSDDQ